MPALHALGAHGDKATPIVAVMVKLLGHVDSRHREEMDDEQSLAEIGLALESHFLTSRSEPLRRW